MVCSTFYWLRDQFEIEIESRRIDTEFRFCIRTLRVLWSEINCCKIRWNQLEFVGNMQKVGESYLHNCEYHCPNCKFVWHEVHSDAESCGQCPMCGIRRVEPLRFEPCYLTIKLTYLDFVCVHLFIFSQEPYNLSWLLLKKGD